jgi:hypothetical protein
MLAQPQLFDQLDGRPEPVHAAIRFGPRGAAPPELGGRW